MSSPPPTTPPPPPPPTLLTLLHISTLSSYLPVTSLLALRLVSHSTNTATTPHAFRTLTLIFTPTLFTPPRLSSLHRIGTHCKTLTIILRYSAHTHIIFQPYTLSDAPRISSPYPLPRDGAWRDGAWVLHDRQNIVVTSGPAELLRAAMDGDGWARFLALLPNLRGVAVTTEGNAVAAGLRRSVVEEAMVSVRRALERRRRGGITEWEYRGAGVGAWVFTPSSGGEKRGVRRGWWREVEVVKIAVGVGGYRGWEGRAVERAVAETVRAMAGSLRVVRLEVSGGPLRLSTARLGECPRLVAVELRGWKVRWGGEDGLGGWLAGRAPLVVSFTGHDLGMEDGDAGWQDLFSMWELSRVQQSAGDAMVLRRKDQQST